MGRQAAGLAAWRSQNTPVLKTGQNRGRILVAAIAERRIVGFAMVSADEVHRTALP